jgi:hypothetical protein
MNSTSGLGIGIILISGKLQVLTKDESLRTHHVKIRSAAQQAVNGANLIPLALYCQGIELQEFSNSV